MRKDISALLGEMNEECIELEKQINYNSYNMILFKKSLAYHYMNTGLLSNVETARRLLSSAAQTFETANFSSPNQYDTFFQIKLLLALSDEFYNKHNHAYSQYENTLREIEKSYKFISKETTSLFQRLMYIISSEDALKRVLNDYSGSSLEIIYQNKRRILEKDIFKGKASETQISEISFLFNQVKQSLDKLYHVTHYRLLFIYYLQKKDYSVSSKLYDEAIKLANEYEFYGQINRFEQLKLEFS